MAGLVSAVFNILICLGIPLMVCLLLWRRNKNGLKIFLLGVCGFLVSQLLLRQPALTVLKNIDGYRVFAALHPTAYLFFLAVTAALFEETARVIIYRVFIKTSINRNTPIFYGLGHGGLEAMTVGLNNVLLLLMASSYLVDTGWIISLAGFESISVMIAQIAFSIMVYVGKRGFLLAIFTHTIYDFMIVLLNVGWSQIALEGVLFVTSMILLAIAIKIQKRSAVK